MCVRPRKPWTSPPAWLVPQPTERVHKVIPVGVVRSSSTPYDTVSPAVLIKKYDGRDDTEKKKGV